MDQTYGKAAEYLKADNSNFTSETVSLKWKGSNAFSNDWQGLSHHLWCPHFNHQPWCPVIRSAIDGPNVWLLNPSITPYSIPSSEESNQINTSYSLPNFSLNFERTAENRTKMTCERSTKAKNKESENERQVEKTYSCRLCTEMDDISDQLAFRKHIENHLGSNRPFFCQICGKQFNFRSTCRNHVMAHMVVRNHFSYSTSKI